MKGFTYSIIAAAAVALVTGCAQQTPASAKSMGSPGDRAVIASAHESHLGGASSDMQAMDAKMSCDMKMDCKKEMSAQMGDEKGCPMMQMMMGDMKMSATQPSTQPAADAAGMDHSAHH